MSTKIVSVMQISKTISKWGCKRESSAKNLTEYVNESRTQLTWSFLIYITKSSEILLQASYKTEQSTCLSLEIPIDSAINAHEVEAHLRDIKRQKKSDDVVLPKIALKSCLERLAEPEELADYFSACLNKRTKVNIYERSI